MAMFSALLIVSLVIGTSSTNLYTLLSKAEDLNQNAIQSSSGAHVSVQYMRRLLRLGKIDEWNVDQFDMSLIETTTTKLRDQTQMNPFTSLFHGGIAIPFFNGYACVTGVMPGAEGKCLRDKSPNGALFGCTGKPAPAFMKQNPPEYRSEHCSCVKCGGMNEFTTIVSSHETRITWVPYCHTRGINNCICGLVDQSIKDAKTCNDLW